MHSRWRAAPSSSRECIFFGNHFIIEIFLIRPSPFVVTISAKEASPAATPPMGWNSWNHFASHIDDKTVRAAADAMASSGMKAAGYQYIVIDDTWAGKRDDQGFIHPNEK